MRIVYSVLLVFLLGGCASTAYISSLADTQYAPKKSDAIFLLNLDSESIKQRQFATFLRSEMFKHGFNITSDIHHADYALIAYADETTSQISSSVVLPQTQYTSGYIGGTYYSGTTTSNQVIPYTENYTVKKIWLHLYSIEDMRNGIEKTIWEGYIGADINEYNKKPSEHLSALFEAFGTNYEKHKTIKAKK